MLCNLSSRKEADCQKLCREENQIPTNGSDDHWSVELDGDDWSNAKNNDSTPYHPSQRVECEVLECVLRAGLPEAIFTSQDEPAEPRMMKKDLHKAQHGNTLAGEPARKKPTRKPRGHPRATEQLTTQQQCSTFKPVGSSESHPSSIAPTADKRALFDTFTDLDDEEDGHELLRPSRARQSPHWARNALEPFVNLQLEPKTVPGMNEGQSIHVINDLSTTFSDAQKENCPDTGMLDRDRKKQEQQRFARLKRKEVEMPSHSQPLGPSFGNHSRRTT